MPLGQIAARRPGEVELGRTINLTLAPPSPAERGELGQSRVVGRGCIQPFLQFAKTLPQAEHRAGESMAEEDQRDDRDHNQFCVSNPEHKNALIWRDCQESWGVARASRSPGWAHARTNSERLPQGNASGFLKFLCILSEYGEESNVKKS